MVGTFPIHKLLFGDERFASKAIQPFVYSFIQIIPYQKFLPQRLRAGPVVFFVGGANEVVV